MKNILKRGQRIRFKIPFEAVGTDLSAHILNDFCWIIDNVCEDYTLIKAANLKTAHRMSFPNKYLKYVKEVS